MHIFLHMFWSHLIAVIDIAFVFFRVSHFFPIDYRLGRFLQVKFFSSCPSIRIKALRERWERTAIMYSVVKLFLVIDRSCWNLHNGSFCGRWYSTLMPWKQVHFLVCLCSTFCQMKRKHHWKQQRRRQAEQPMSKLLSVHWLLQKLLLLLLRLLDLRLVWLYTVIQNNL